MPTLSRMLKKHYVASHAEAWIEIRLTAFGSRFPIVASHAEAWIEISRPWMQKLRRHRCLSCRGVNWNIDEGLINSQIAGCLSCRGVNWNICKICKRGCAKRLPLMQRRELKYSNRWRYNFRLRLPLMQRRELKYNNTGELLLVLQLPLMQRRELKLSCFRPLIIDVCCLSCRGVNWNRVLSLHSTTKMLPLMQRRELK